MSQEFIIRERYALTLIDAMRYLNERNITKLLIGIVTVLCLPQAFAAQKTASRLAPAQSLESKLAQEAVFVPGSDSPLGQLIEVSKHYRIPMGIEWIDQPSRRAIAFTPQRGMTVRTLIELIVHQAPGYGVSIENGVLHISSPAVALNPKSFLNLRIDGFAAKEENLFDVEARLRLSIDMTLHPERYLEGFFNDYGYPPGHVFTVNNITFSGSNLTVREILDNIAVASGNALWIVETTTAGIMIDTPLTNKQQLSGDNEAAEQPTWGGFTWRFEPFTEAESHSRSFVLRLQK